MFTIADEYIQITVNKTGAELSGLKSVKNGIEYLWEADPEVWASHAPNLFPVIGCLKNGGFLYNGKEYSCPKHGFIRNNHDVLLIEKTDSSLKFGLKYNEQYLKIYPFKFEFFISYVLCGNELLVKHEVLNHGDEDMLFSVGGHPGFRCPLHEDEEYSDYYLEFEKDETARSCRMQEDGLIGKETVPVFYEPKIINLNAHLFDHDALILKNLNSSVASLKSRKSGQAVVLNFAGFPYLGIWAKPGAEYVCIEPWIGIADSWDSDRRLENKEGLVKLSPGKRFNAVYSIKVEEKNV